MSVIVNEVRRGTYLDSVSLMRLTQELKRVGGVEEAGLMVGTPANRAILREAGVLGTEGETAGSGDLVIAVRASGAASAQAALALARELLSARRDTAAGSGTQWQPRTLRSALQAVPDANLALISVPGDFAIAEARKALARGLNVMIFSDNVSIAEEVALKREAAAAGLLVMGPDCGTAIIAGTPLAFANAVPRGDIGIIGASGTGIQEVSSLIARHGRGVSHAIGTGGRDLKAEVGGMTTLAALDLLEADAATRGLVLISKPPAAEVARAVLARVARLGKPCTVCFIGSGPLDLPANARRAATLEEAAAMACGLEIDPTPVDVPGVPRGPLICGLYAGGTLAAEAQVVMRQAGLVVRSNAPIEGVPMLADIEVEAGHTLIDLGDDRFTRGRPHPMIEPAVRDEMLARAAAARAVGVVLLDVVLGFGAHADPAGYLADRVARLKDRPIFIASVTGTASDRQGYAGQVAKLETAGITVAPSNAAAARLAVAVAGRA